MSRPLIAPRRSPLGCQRSRRGFLSMPVLRARHRAARCIEPTPSTCATRRRRVVDDRRHHDRPVGWVYTMSGLVQHKKRRARDLASQRLAIREREHRIRTAVDHEGGCDDRRQRRMDRSSWDMRSWFCGMQRCWRAESRRTRARSALHCTGARLLQGDRSSRPSSRSSTRRFDQSTCAPRKKRENDSSAVEGSGRRALLETC